MAENLTIEQIAESIQAGSWDSDASDGAMVSIEKRFNNDEIVGIESRWNVDIPDDFKKWLTLIGAGTFRLGDSNRQFHVEIRRPDHMCAGVASMDGRPDERLFAVHIPVGRNVANNEMLLLGVGQHNMSKLFSIPRMPGRWRDLQIRPCDGVDFASWIASAWNWT